ATRKKLSLFCQVAPQNVISLHDVSNLYRVPMLLADQEVGRIICEQLLLPSHNVAPALSIGSSDAYQEVPTPIPSQRLGDWSVLADRTDSGTQGITIAVVGKYTGNVDAYTSVVKALQHAAMEANLRLTLEWVDSVFLEANAQQLDAKKHEVAWATLRAAQGVLVPGGFGTRGIEGKVATAAYCRQSQVPYLGICVGLQTAVIDFARNVMGWEGANSTEFDEATPHPVVEFLPEGSTTIMGGTM
ncbi:unnamed protein product, partial [Polarella glacialis]